MTIPLTAGDTVRIIANSAQVTMAMRNTPHQDYATADQLEGWPGFYLIDHTIVGDNIQVDDPGFRIRTGAGNTDNFTIFFIRLYR